MKKIFIILFTIFFLLSCFGGDKTLNISKNTNINTGTLITNKEDKEIIFDELYIGENIPLKFKEIEKIYNSKDCEGAKKIIKKLKDNNPETESVKDFLENTELGKQYTTGVMCEGKINDEMSLKFKEIEKLYNSKDCEGSKNMIKKLKDNNPETESVKDFLENTELGKQYTIGVMCKGKNKDVTSDKFKEIEKAYNLNDCNKTILLIEQLKEEKSDVESVKDFLENTELGKQYTSGTMCGLLEEKLIVNKILLKFKKIREVYDSKECIKAKELMQQLKEEEGNTKSVKEFFKDTKLGKKYIEGIMCNNN